MRIHTGQTTHRGYPKPQRRRLDMVAFLRINYQAWRPVVVGVEIKVSEHDLLSDTKLPDYLPYCDAFYLAVSAELHIQADERIDADLLHYGLILVFAGHTATVVKLPDFVPVGPSPWAELYGRVVDARSPK